MNKRAATFAGSFLVFAFIIYMLVLAPTADDQHKQALVSHDQAIQDSALDNLIVSDLKTPNIRAGIVAKTGNYYEFNISALDSQEGGAFAVIAQMTSNQRFQEVWEGNGIPPCPPIIQYNIPPGIAPFCEEIVVVDRSNPIRSAYTQVFNPHVDARGSISF